ncbi:hypothetical protein IFM89_025591 [Coptis chinensis]|uniref:DUF4283 domain-containing protein n=1 Tax=Coptis chinensis TaxID=261450 RepID=A0A835LSQ9_9MAGN|nr:hypothetical protein IFM89_025591 [Coptis chinensis]
MTTIKSALEKAWYPFKIEDMVLYKGEIYQIRLESQEQVAALLLGQPWIVAQHIFQIIPWMDFYETKELNFSKFYVWMHLHNYPEVYLDKEIIEGNLMESGYFDMSDLKFMELYPKTESHPSCVRVKVVLDVHAPIPPGFLIPESINGVDWISFGFEYLPVFCFKCGFIGHHFAACNVTEDSHGTEVRVSPGGQRFQFYSSKTRYLPKPFGDRIVYGFSLLFTTDLNQPFLPMITNVADSSVNSKRINTTAEHLKAPMIIDISSPQLPAHDGPNNETGWQIPHDHLPLAVEAHNPGQLGFSTQMDFNNFHPLHELECPSGFAQISTDPQKLHFIDLAQLHNQAVHQEDYSYKRQEISQGVAAKDKMQQDGETVNELVENPKDSMSLLAWNSRGSGRPSMMEELKKQIKDVRPLFSFIMETKCPVNKGVSLIKRLGDFESFVVPSRGLSGGLWIFWDNSVVVEVLMSDSWFIHCKISVKVNGVHEGFFLSCVYGNSKSCIRRLQWPVLTMFKPPNNESWLLMGDFNEITCPEEKCGGKLFNYPKARNFLDMMDNCELFDLGFVGSIYTWTNRQNGRHRIWERIDRMMANEGWSSRFSGCRVHHVLATSSDHKFLILKLLQDRVTVRRPFRFEIMWVQHEGCQEQIRNAFHNEVRGSPSFVLCKKLQNCQEKLKWWNKYVFGEVEHKLDCVLQRLSEIQSLIENDNDTEDLFRVENDLILWNIMISWNYIHSIRDRNGGILTERRQIGDRLSEFFEDTMTTSDPDLMSQIFNVQAPSLAEDEKSNLLKGVTTAEIVTALKHMKPFKSPGPDGYQAFFSKDLKNLVGIK